MKHNFQQDLSTLGISEALVEGILRSDMLWLVKTSTFHNAVKNARKAQLKKYHPDICKDPDATIKAAEINAAADGLLSIQFQPRPQPVMQQVIIFHSSWGNSWTNAGTTSTGSFWSEW